MRSGFKRMDTDPAIDFKLEDYNAQIVDRGLAMTNRQLGPTHFTNFINVGLKEVLTCAIQKYLCIDMVFRNALPLFHYRLIAMSCQCPVMSCLHPCACGRMWHGT
jgi:hypothetical protein